MTGLFGQPYAMVRRPDPWSRSEARSQANPAELLEILGRAPAGLSVISLYEGSPHAVTVEWVEQGRRVGRRLREMGYPEKGVQYRAGYYPGKDGKR